jgi:hypothetical protein
MFGTTALCAGSYWLFLGLTVLFLFRLQMKSAMPCDNMDCGM